jgi:mono/diheme cytochrome c family protein
MLKNALGAAALLAVVVAPAWAESADAFRGQAYVNGMCSSCHAVGADGASANAVAPAFRTITLAFKSGDEFATYLNTKHPVMQTPPIHAQQADDMALYIASLKAAKPK